MTEAGPNAVVVIDGVHRVWQWVGFTMPHDHLAATSVEGGQIRVFRVVDELECLAVELLVERKRDVSVEIEGEEIIVGVFKYRILKERGGLPIWHCPERLSLIKLTRRRRSRIDLFSPPRVQRSGIHTLE